MNEVYCRAGVCERRPAAFGGSPICKGLPCPTSFAGPGALKTTEEKAEVPSLDKEGWLRPLRKCREASLAGTDGVVGSSRRLSEVERTTPFLMFRPTGLTLAPHLQRNGTIYLMARPPLLGQGGDFAFPAGCPRRPCPADDLWGNAQPCKEGNTTAQTAGYAAAIHPSGTATAPPPSGKARAAWEGQWFRRLDRRYLLL